MMAATTDPFCATYSRKQHLQNIPVKVLTYFIVEPFIRKLQQKINNDPQGVQSGRQKGLPVNVVERQTVHNTFTSHWL